LPLSNSPISTEVPCGKVIGLIFPQVKGLSMLSDDYQQAREQLDRGWLIQNGVNIPPDGY